MEDSTNTEIEKLKNEILTLKKEIVSLNDKIGKYDKIIKGILNSK